MLLPVLDSLIHLSRIHSLQEKKKGGEQWDLGNFYLFKFHSKFECGRK